MIYEFGDMWSQWDRTDIFVITGCYYLANDGHLVMGRGIAKEMADRYPTVPLGLGVLIKQHIASSLYSFDEGCYNLFNFKIDNQKCMIFQVKKHFKDVASLSIVDLSAKFLQVFAEEHPDLRIDIVYPAIGAGKKSIKEIEPLIKNWPDNIHVWRRPKERRNMKWGKGDPTKVKPQYAARLLNWLDLPEDGEKLIRLIGEPILWQVHWLSIWGSDGEKRLVQPYCCVAFDPEELIKNVGEECILCDEDTVPKGTSYVKDWDQGPAFRGFTLCIDREAQAKGEDFIKVYSFPVSVYEEIETYAHKWGDPADAKEGYDLTIKKERTGESGKQQFIKYKIIPDRDAAPITAAESKAWKPVDEALKEFYCFRDNDELEARVKEIRASLDDQEFSDPKKKKDDDNGEAEQDKEQGTEEIEEEEKDKEGEAEPEDESGGEEKDEEEETAEPSDDDIDEMFKKLKL